MIELLVATAILSLLVVLLVDTLNRTGHAWTAGESQIERRQSARAMADSIAQELNPALLSIDPNDQTGVQMVLNTSNIPPIYRNPDAIFWQAPLATDRSKGDIAEIGYFLQWDTSVPSQPKPLFSRFFVNPTDATNYLIFKAPAGWLTGDIIKTMAPAVKKAPVPYQGLFAENVIGFWVRCYSYDKSNPPKLTLITDGNGNNTFDSRVSKNLPVKIKIYLVLVDDTAIPKIHEYPLKYELAKRANAADEATKGPDLDAFITSLPDGVRQTARTFTAEVRLQNAL